MSRRMLMVLLVVTAGLALAGTPAVPGAADGNEAPGAPLAQRSLTLSEAVTCLRLDDGRAKCLGSNEFGALGQGSIGYGSVGLGADLLPISFPGGRTPEALTSGFHDVCAVLDDGGLSCWGNNGAGQLGNGSTQHSGSPQSPVPLGAGRTATAAAVGLRTVCALLDDGTVKCWGQGTSGALGQGDTANRGDGPGELGDTLPPIPLGAGRTATAITAGQYFGCALLDDGTVKCWGENGNGQLGQGDTADRGDNAGELGDALPPIPLGAGRTATAISAGDAFSCALLDDGTVKCWGKNSDGQLGQGDTAHRGDNAGELGDTLPPIPLGTGRTATAISAGASHACALLDDRTVKCWGANNLGQLGQGDTSDRGDNAGELGDTLPPVALGTGRTATSASTGGESSCALLDDGTVKCWGSSTGDAAGEMGDALAPEPFTGNGIWGRVTADGNGVSSLVAVLDADDFHLEAAEATSSAGYFTTSVAPGDHFVYVIPAAAHAPGFYGSPTLVPVGGGDTTTVNPTVTPTRGSVTGTVRDAGTHNPVAGALAVLLDSQTGAPRRVTTADGSGRFTFASLPPADWYVGAIDPTGGHRPTFFPGVPDVPSATRVSAPAGAEATADIDQPSQPTAGTGTAISGRVTEAGTGTALTGVVTLGLRSSDFAFERATTTSNGNYNLFVPAGTHRVAFLDPSMIHPMEWYEDQPYSGLASSTVVTSPVIVDATLTAATGTGTLAGTVRDQGSARSAVWVLAIGNQGIAGTATSSYSGAYTIGELPPGNYWVGAVDPATAVLEYVPDAPTIAGASLFAVTADHTTTVDVTLR